jgi:hypothetical protein
MKAEPAFVERTKLSLKPRRNCTAGEASEPKVAVAITHFGGVHGPVVVTVEADEVVDKVPVVVVTVVGVTTSVTGAVAVIPPPVPLTVMMAVVPGAVLETAIPSTELVASPAGGVTGLGVKPPVTPDGNVGTDRATGELKEPIDCTVTLTVPTPPGLRVRLLGVTDTVKEAPVVVVVTAVAVNDPLADFPVLPTARTV